MKKLMLVIALSVFTLTGCTFFNELKAGREFCKENPITCQDGVDEKADKLSTKAAEAVAPLVTAAVAATPAAPIAPVAGAAAGSATKTAASYVLTLILGAWIGRRNFKKGIKDPAPVTNS